MKGNNTIVINKQTMCAAIEYWLKNVIMKSENVKVNGVSEDGKHIQDGFRVYIETLEDETIRE